ncbi:aldolase/citrate lyase family protein [Luteipulveratus sp. YIM 133132]|uniref:DUF6986 family protein n=1 Tax=Luteipulveratus flavus TaxID=3031728 RepID=UPI0023AF2032|nr:aldolase/citrate lyase family protein [Luteipulveratus sp. YIM 133132]MDE9364141.1 aldolase/citrate lyase family protein [Luteipulveratus sp. YIM 133132]
MPESVEDLTRSLTAALDRRLSDWDARLAERYPGDRVDRQPVHTAYIPADRFDVDAVRRWGASALDLLASYAPTSATLAAAVGEPVADVEAVYERVRAKLATEPIENLRVDFEDGYGGRPDDVEDADVAATVAALRSMDGRPAWFGIRFKSFEAPTRARGVRTLVAFLSGLVDGPRLPDGLVVTLPKVTSVEQVAAMASACSTIESALGIASDSVGFEIQVETAQAVMGVDGTAPVAAMIDAADGRCAGLHYGTYDYSAGLGIAAAYQSLDHPVADHAKAVMQVAAAQTGVRVADGSTNVVAFGSEAEACATWALHHRLVTRSLERGIYQGWDLHPGHLPTRYLATYLFHRRALPDAAARLRAYVGRVESGIADEPATARMLASSLLRGVRCGALDLDEVSRLADLDEPTLLALATTG